MVLTMSSSNEVASINNDDDDSLIDDDSQPGDLQRCHEDDTKVKPQEKTQCLMTLCFSTINDFTTDTLPSESENMLGCDCSK